jgi:hypothetical protein
MLSFIAYSPGIRRVPYHRLERASPSRAPNNWRVESGGKLVKDIETEEYKAALGYLRDLVASGCVSPDLKTNADLNNDVLSGPGSRA